MADHAAAWLLSARVQAAIRRPFAQRIWASTSCSSSAGTRLGGVCLNVGCIPSKALLHAAKVIDDAEAMAEHGVEFGKPKIDALKLRDWKNKVVGTLTGGLTQLAKQRKVRVVHGYGEVRIREQPAAR